MLHGERHGLSVYRKLNEALRLESFQFGKPHGKSVMVNEDYEVVINYKEGEKNGMAVVRLKGKEAGEIRNYAEGQAHGHWFLRKELEASKWV